MTVTFLKRCNQYNAGELAEFPDAEAQRLIQHEFAAAVTKPVKASPVSKEAKTDDEPDKEGAHADGHTGHSDRSVRAHRK